MKVSRTLILGISLLLFSTCSDDPSGPGAGPPSGQSGWRSFDSGTTAHLHGVWGASAVDVFAVGDGGVILHFDGNSWSEMTSGTKHDLVDVWGASSDEVFVTGDSGTVLRYDGEEWSPVPLNVTDPIGRMWGRAVGDSTAQLYMIVEDGPTALIGYYDGSWYETRRPVIPGIERFTDLTGILNISYHPRVILMLLVGENGGAFGFEVEWDNWWTMETGVDEDLVAISGSNWYDLVAVGRESTLIRHNGYEWVPVEGPTGGDLLAVGRREHDDIFVTGASGQIYNYDYCSAGDMTSNTMAALNSVWGTTAGTVFAAGDGGVVLRYDDAPENPTCPDNVTVSVTGGPTTVITWSPPCHASKVIVQAADDTPFWFVAADGNTIAPGVIYGVTPECAVEWRPASPNIALGGLLRVSVIRADTEGDVLVGAWNFEPTAEGWVGRRASETTPATPHSRYAQELRLIAEPVPDEPEIHRFGDVIRVPLDAAANNVRPVVVIDWVEDPETGQIGEKWHYDIRAMTSQWYSSDVVFDRMAPAP